MSRVKEVTLQKVFKIGLPNFSNQTIGVFMTWDIAENEEFNFEKGWDIINHQLDIQAGDNDQSWIKVNEHKDKYKATINIPK